MLCPSCGQDNREGRLYCAECGGSLALTCASCGTQNEPGEKFCGKCGASLAEATRSSRTPTPAPAPALPTSFAGGRYQVQRFLGEGGRKRVYLAHDTRLDRDVAIAIIKTEGLDEASLARVSREAQAMGRLGDHPHIVTVFDIGDEGGPDGQAQPYIVSQYMAGGDLEGLLREAKDRRLPLEDALRIGDQVCQALEHAHNRGIIHRDLKPGNVWLTEAPPAQTGKQGSLAGQAGQAQTAKLGDFGLAVAIDRSRLTVAGMMVGTVAYMPPEQALGGDADARSDLYSLGCVLYEMVTGRPPFLGDDTVGVISQHINTPPLDPSWHNPQVPQGLEALILRLLAKSPDDRPASAAEVRAALSSIASAPAEPARAEPAAAPAQRRVVQFGRSRFVGREKELGQIKDRLEEALSGRGSLLMVVGEPGIGKTRLSEELAVYARLRGAQVLLGQCYESEGAPPYIPFVEALRQYVDSRPTEALREEMGDGASDLSKLVSEIRGRVPDIPPSPPQEPEAERYRLLEAVASFLVNASTANPLLLVLDDIHWADKPSLLLLQHLARRLSGSRILVVGTYRDVELDRRHPLSEVIAELRRERLYERVLLRGLDHDGVYALIVAMAQGQNVPRVFATNLHEQTEGNPFFIEEILYHLVEIGALSRQEGRWVGDPAAIAENIPEGVREVIGRRLSRLSEATNQALTFASVLGREFDFDVLQALAEMDEDTLLSSVEEALGAQLIAEHRGPSGASYRFTHALVQETLYGELSIARKQRFHLRAGLALEQARADRLEPHIGQLAHHFYQGNDPAKAIDYSRQAGEAALRIYAWEEAIRHWETALEIIEEQGDSEEERAQLLEHLGDITYVSGIDFEKGISFLEKALAIYEGMGARGKVAAMHSRLGRALVSFPERLDLQKGPAHLEAARAILEQDAPGSPGLAYVYLGLCSACLYTLETTEEGLANARRALDIGERLNSRPVIANALAFVGHFLTWTGKLREGLGLIEKGWKMADEDNLTFVAYMGTVFFGMSSLHGRRDHEGAKGWFQRELDKPRIASAPQLRWFLLGMLGQTHIVAGEMEEAHRIRDAGNELSFFLRALEVASGEWEAAEEHLLADLEESRHAGNFGGLWTISLGLGDLCLRRGQYDRAEEYLRTCLEIEERERRLGREMRSSVMLAQLLARTGRLEEAQQHVDLCLGVLAEGEDWGGAAGLVALARGAVLAAQGVWAEGEEALDEALAVAREYGVPWDEADALHERARMHLARGEKNDLEQAIRLLDETIAIYQRLGAKKHLELVLADKLQAQGIDTSDVRTSIDAVASAVYTEQPDLPPKAVAPDGTVTILFSDIEGSTAITERLGDQRWLELLRGHNAIVREKVAAHEGYEVKSEGDGFMLAFGSARRALQCAVDIQRAFAQHSEGAEEPIRVRIGLHTGEAIREADDFYGKNVILAARIAGQAKGGEILVSSLLKELTESAGDIEFGEGQEVELKGLSGQHQVFEVVWADSD